MDEAPARLRSKASWLINKVSLHAHRLRSEGLATVDARAYHFSILAALNEYGPASQASIGQRCGIDRSDTHAMVNELVDQGLVMRALDPQDRRRNIITINAAGQKRLEQLDLVLGQVQDNLLATLSPTERRQLVGLLARVLDSHNTPMT
jgi:DNA-binding MarR family transcriptional regulator